MNGHILIQWGDDSDTTKQNLPLFKIFLRIFGLIFFNNSHKASLDDGESSLKNVESHSYHTENDSEKKTF